MAVKVDVYEANSKELTYRHGMTLGQALQESGVTSGSHVTVRVNRKKYKPHKMNHVLRDGDRVTVTPNIRNG